jgi:hypothetical protein
MPWGLRTDDAEAKAHEPDALVDEAQPVVEVDTDAVSEDDGGRVHGAIRLVHPCGHDVVHAIVRAVEAQPIVGARRCRYRLRNDDLGHWCGRLGARHELAKGLGIGRVARMTGLGTGTVHKLKREMTARSRS